MLGWLCGFMAQVPKLKGASETCRPLAAGVRMAFSFCGAMIACLRQSMLFVLLSKGRRVVLEEAFSTACSLLEDRDAIAGLGRRDSAFIGLLVPVFDNAVRDALLTAGWS